MEPFKTRTSKQKIDDGSNQLTFVVLKHGTVNLYPEHREPRELIRTFLATFWHVDEVQVLGLRRERPALTFITTVSGDVAQPESRRDLAGVEARLDEHAVELGVVEEARARHDGAEERVVVRVELAAVRGAVEAHPAAPGNDHVDAVTFDETRTTA